MQVHRCVLLSAARPCAQGNCDGRDPPPFETEVELSQGQCAIDLGTVSRTFLSSASASIQQTTVLHNLLIHRRHTEGDPVPAISIIGGQIAIFKSTVESNEYSASAVNLENAKALIEGAAFPSACEYMHDRARLM